MITRAEIIAQEVERQVEQTFLTAVAAAEQDGNNQIAGQLRLDLLAHALEGFKYEGRRGR